MTEKRVVNRFNGTLSICLCLTTLLAHAQAVRRDDTRSCTTIQSSGTQRLFESVSAAALNRNNGYTLSFPPSESEPRCAFFNGLEMTPEADYTLEGPNFTLINHVAPKDNDVIQVVYSVQTKSHSSLMDQHESSTETGREVLLLLLDRALSDQLSEDVGNGSIGATTGGVAEAYIAMSPPDGLAGQAIGLRRRPLPSHAAESQIEYRAISMLSTILDAEQTEATHRGAGRQHKQDRSAQGVEGLGDFPFNSTFAGLNVSQAGVMLSRHRRGLNAEGRDLAKDSMGNLKESPRSLRMLRQRIQEAR